MRICNWTLEKFLLNLSRKRYPYLSSGKLDQNADAACLTCIRLIWDLRGQLHLHPLDFLFPLGLFPLQAQLLLFLALFLLLLLFLLAFLFLVWD